MGVVCFSTWESLGKCDLVLGKVTPQFLYHCRKIVFPKLLDLVGGVALRKDNVIECYRLLCLLGLEFGLSGTSDTGLLATEIQDLAHNQPGLTPTHRYLLHSYVAGLLYLLGIISEKDSLEVHVSKVLEERRQAMPILLPDKILQEWADPMTEDVGEVEEGVCLFQLKEKGLLQQTPEMMRNSSEHTRTCVGDSCYYY